MRCPTHLTQSLVTAVKASPAHPPRRDIALEDRSVGSVVVDDRDAQPGKGRGVLRPPDLLRRLAEQLREPEPVSFPLLPVHDHLAPHVPGAHAGAAAPDTGPTGA